jgi:hypothetical protein
MGMHMQLRLRYLAIGALASLLAAGTGWAQEVMLSPQISQIEMAAGSTREFEISIGNPSETRPITVAVGIASLAQNQRGDYTVSRTSNQWSCASWIETDAKQLAIRPGEVATVKCKILAPHIVRGSRYAAVTVDFKEPGDKGPMATDMTYELASFVEVTITGSSGVRKADISGLTIKPVYGSRALEVQYGKDAFYIMAEVRNTGTVGVTAKAVLRIRDQKGLHSREVPLGEGRGMVIPGATVSYRSLFSTRPPPGIYIAEASLDYEGIRPSVAKCTFSVAGDGRMTLGALETVATVGLGVSPRTIDVTAARRSTRTLSIALNNVEDYPIKVRTALSPLTQSPDGRFLVRTDQAADTIDYTWIEMDPAVAEIPAHSKQRIKMTLRVPADAGSSEYVRVALTPDAPELSPEMLRETYSTDLFLTVPPGLTQKVEVKSVSVRTVRRFAPVEIVFEIQNMGNHHIDIDAQATINGSGGKMVKELRFPGRDTRILPGVTRKFTITDQQGLEAGAYTCDVSVRVGGSQVAFKSGSLKISG